MSDVTFLANLVSIFVHVIYTADGLLSTSVSFSATMKNKEEKNKLNPTLSSEGIFSDSAVDILNNASSDTLQKSPLLQLSINCKMPGEANPASVRLITGSLNAENIEI